MRFLLSLIFIYAGWFFSNQWFDYVTPDRGVDPLETTLIVKITGWAILSGGVLLGILSFYLSSPSRTDRNVEFNSISGQFSPFWRVTGLSLCFLLVTFHIKTSILERVRVRGNSMYPTLRDGETLWIEKLTVGFVLPTLSFPLANDQRIGKIPEKGIKVPSRSSIVVFRYPGTGRLYFIKRVIGLPGDRFRFAGGGVLINDRKIEEPYLPPEMITRSIPDVYQSPLWNFPPELSRLDPLVKYSAMNGCGHQGIVPEHTLLVLGDNRSSSRDSRSLGFIPLFYVVGVMW